MTTTLKINKGWMVKKTKDKNSETIVAVKKIDKPTDDGYSRGYIKYSVSYYNNKSK